MDCERRLAFFATARVGSNSDYARFVTAPIPHAFGHFDITRSVAGEMVDERQIPLPLLGNFHDMATPWGRDTHDMGVKDFSVGTAQRVVAVEDRLQSRY